MKERTRYRLTGSLFLLALAVIGLPMLFDGAGLPARELPDMSTETPLWEQPETRVEMTGDSGTGRAPASDLAARVSKLREQVDEEGFLTRSGTRFGEPVLTPPSADTDVWAVQVASFREAGNAEDLRTRLREDGYEAFLSTVKTGERILSRVAVGPLLARDRAERLRGELSARYRVEARLMAFSN